MAEIGSTLFDKYEILEKIGQGGMSKVYKVRDKRLNKYWALKEIDLKEQNQHQDIFEQSIIGEMELLKRLEHPALPRIIDYFKKDGIIYIVIDYIAGETLSQRLERQGAQPEELVINWALQLCNALTYLHTRNPRIIYRDMKPGNIMINEEGSIRLIDFGIAREYKTEGREDTTYLGTKGYAAPEQFGGKGQTDPRTDIYSLGVTLYHLVTGNNPCHPPYEIMPIRQINPSLSRGLEEIIKRCVQPAPDKRFQSCEQLKTALQHYKEVDEKEGRKKVYFGITFVSALLLGIGSIVGLVFESFGKGLFGDSATGTKVFLITMLLSIGLFSLAVVLFLRWNIQEVFRNGKAVAVKEEKKHSDESRLLKSSMKSELMLSKDRSQEQFKVTREIIFIHTDEVI